jgi:hypothetical protein
MVDRLPDLRRRVVETPQEVDRLLLDQAANGVRHASSTRAQRAKEKIERHGIKIAVATKAERLHATVADSLSEEICDVKSRRVNNSKGLDALNEDC